MRVDKKLLKKEKMIFGDDFTPVCESWSMYLGIKITPKDVAMMMAQMKDTRIKFVQDRLNDLRDKPDFLINKGIQEAYKIYKNTLEESKQKKTHYLFIATNFEEYKNL